MTEAVQVTAEAQIESPSASKGYTPETETTQPMVNVQSNASRENRDQSGSKSEHGTPTRQPVYGDPEKQKEASEASNENWYWTDEVPGDGERPEWLAGKFKNVSEQAKAYSELEKKIGSFSGAPDEYEIEPTETLEQSGFDTEDPLFQEFEQFAKENNMSNEMFNKLLNLNAQRLSGLSNITDEQIAEYKKAEMAKLGEDGPQMVNRITNWAKNNLSESEYEAFADNLDSAEMIGVVNKLLDGARHANVVGSDTQSTSINTREKARALLSDAKFGKDGEYTKWAMKEYERSLMSGNIG